MGAVAGNKVICIENIREGGRRGEERDGDDRDGEEEVGVDRGEGEG